MTEMVLIQQGVVWDRGDFLPEMKVGGLNVDVSN